MNAIFERTNLKYLALAFTLAAALSMIAASSASALESRPAEAREKVQEKMAERESMHSEHNSRVTATEHQERTTGRNETAKTKLSEAKLKVCKKREAAINRILINQSERSTKHLMLFDTIAERAQSFYADRELTLTNYEALVIDVEAKKATAESAVAELSTSDTAFSCDSDNPKAFIQSFVAERKVATDALREYRTAVKDLIVGIKSIVGATTSEVNRAEETE